MAPSFTLTVGVMIRRRTLCEVPSLTCGIGKSRGHWHSSHPATTPLNSTNLPMREMLYLLVALGLKTTPTSTRLHPTGQPKRGCGGISLSPPPLESHRRQRMEICLHTTTIGGQVRARACLLLWGHRLLQ